MINDIEEKNRFSASIHLNNSIAIPSGPACLLFFVVLRAWSNSSSVNCPTLNWFCNLWRASDLGIVCSEGLFQCFCSKYVAIVSALSFGATSSPFKSLSLINCGCDSLRDPLCARSTCANVTENEVNRLGYTTPPLINLYSWQSSNPLKPLVC